MSAVRNLAAGARRAFPDACLLALRLSGWLIVTGLAALGCFVLFFLMLGGFSADGFFSHLANLARRFVAADAARKADFLSLLGTVSLVIAAIVSVCRWRSLYRSFSIQEPAHV